MIPLAATTTILVLFAAAAASASGNPKLEAARAARALILRARASMILRVHRLQNGSDADPYHNINMGDDAQVTGASPALADCWKLYGDSDSRLVRLLGSLDDVDDDDAQAWLSGVAANHRTCLDGLKEKGEFVGGVEAVEHHKNLSVVLGEALGLYARGTMKGRGKGKKGIRGKPPTYISGGLLVSWDATTYKADIVVAKDGSGDCRTINEAVFSLSKMEQAQSESRVIVYVKSGIYDENVEIGPNMRNIMFVGDGIDQSIITGHRNVPDGASTYSSATFGVSGDGFWARDMTFENTAGPAKQQAVALRVNADRSVFYRCSFKGYQDTLFVLSLRQFYRDCQIYGTIDFIFGNAAAVLQNCDIIVRKPLNHQFNTITAQGRYNPNESTGISIHGSRVIPSPELSSVTNSFHTYLGRPWKMYSRTIILKTYLDGLVDREGWIEWNGNFALSTLFYGEYMNTGMGASTGGRVNWTGFHVLQDSRDVSPFTTSSFIQGDSWIPETGVPFIVGI